MYTTLVPHILAIKRKVNNAITTAMHENHVTRCIAVSQVMNDKLFRIQSLFNSFNYSNSALADNLVMIEWVKQQEKHQQDKLDAAHNRFLQGYAPDDYYPLAYGCHIKFR